MNIDAVTMTLLFDYYGELLTEKQKTCFDLYYNQDYSLAEIAQDEGISRQGVHDSLLRGSALLKNFEEKIGCVARAAQTQQALTSIRAAAQTLSELGDHNIQALAQEILAAAGSIKE